MNDLLLRLDTNNKDHKLFANILLGNFFRIINEDILFEFMYTSTMEHRLKVNMYPYRDKGISWLTSLIVTNLLFNHSYYRPCG